jgi:ABC-type sugar transport system ATPase subunit
MCWVCWIRRIAAASSFRGGTCLGLSENQRARTTVPVHRLCLSAIQSAAAGERTGETWPCRLIYRAERPAQTPEDLLRQVGLGDRMAPCPERIVGLASSSGGAIARALMNGPRIVMADEPTGNLDSASSADILRLLHELNERGLTVILVTHDPDIAAKARRIITIRDGRIVEDVRRGAPVELHEAARAAAHTEPVERRGPARALRLGTGFPVAAGRTCVGGQQGADVSFHAGCVDRGWRR